MSEASLPTTPPPGPTVTITLTPSPTTIFTTNRITFSTIISFATVTETSVIEAPTPPPSELPRNTAVSAPLDRNFIILVSLTGATFLLLLILTTLSTYVLRQRRRIDKRMESPPLIPLSSTAPPPPPPPPQLPPAVYGSTFSPIFLSEEQAEEERPRPITAPPQRPRRSASTPFLGPEYENKGFIMPSQGGMTEIQKQKQKQKQTEPTEISPSSWQFPPSLPQPTAQNQDQAVREDRPDFTHLDPSTLLGPNRSSHGVGSWFEINPVDVAGLEHEEEIEIETEGDRKDSEDQRETFDFFRYPVAGQGPQGTRASSGVFPEGGRGDDG